MLGLVILGSLFLNIILLGAFFSNAKLLLPLIKAKRRGLLIIRYRMDGSVEFLAPKEVKGAEIQVANDYKVALTKDVQEDPNKYFVPFRGEKFKVLLVCDRHVTPINPYEMEPAGMDTTTLFHIIERESIARAQLERALLSRFADLSKYLPIIVILFIILLLAVAIAPAITKAVGGWQAISKSSAVAASASK